MDNSQTKIPNVIYSDGKTTIGFLENHQNFLDFKVENQYCIQNPRRFEMYKRAGYNLYIIDNGFDEPFMRYAIVIVKKGSGKRTYWGMDDIPMDRSGQREFENTLSDEGLNFINNICNELKTENKQYNTNRNMKQTIRLTESKLRDMIQEAVNGAMTQRRPMRKTQPKRLTENRLRDMIKESVRTALNEMDARTYASAARGLKRKKDPYAYLEGGYYDADAMHKNDELDARAEELNNAAADAWNRKYGDKDYHKTGVYRNMNYVPDYDGFELRFSDGGESIRPYYHIKDDAEDEGLRVASQMAKGTGEYIKGKGWQ